MQCGQSSKDPLNKEFRDTASHNQGSCEALDGTSTGVGHVGGHHLPALNPAVTYLTHEHTSEGQRASVRCFEQVGCPL